MAKKEVKLPEIGEGVTEGELVNWLVKVGDLVKADQPVAELMTDKATVEVPTPVAGKVTELKFNPGDTVTVESTILVLETDAAASTSAPAPKAAATPSSGSAPATGEKALAKNPNENPKQNAPAQSASASSENFSSTTKKNTSEMSPPVADIRVLATPATRRLAREMNVDINQIEGTGLAGRVTRDDVSGMTSEHSARNGSAGSENGKGTKSNSSFEIPRPSYKGQQGAAEERVPLRGIRKKIAENLQMAKHIIPHFTLMDEANITELVKLREDLKPHAEAKNVKITFMPFVVKALVATVREFPMFNASIDDAAQEIVYKQYFNVGFAADTPNGLLVPVIKNADQKTLVDLSRDISDLAKKARDGKLALEEMKGATFTITNIGSVGGTYATPIINHPEVAIFGMYKIQERPIIQDGELAVAKYMNFTVTCDHRLIDGAVAARFLTAFIKRIENPGVLMLDMI